MEKNGYNHCKKCNKNYSSYKSLWNHNKTYHNIDTTDVVSLECQPNVSQNADKENRTYSCINCKKIYKHRQSLWKHTDKCDVNINKQQTISLIKENNEILIKEMKEEMQELKNIIQKSLKIHPKTLNKINNQLINQGTINNTINIVQLGNENLIDILSEKQKLRILERQAMSLNDLIELIHISPQFKQFKNVCITNLQSSFGQKYDEKSKKFIAVNKNELLNEIVDCRMYDIEKFYDENKDKMIPHKANQIKKFIDRMNNEEDIMKGIKKEEIKLILYNNHDNINNKEIIV